MWAHDQPWFFNIIQKREIIDMDHSSPQRTDSSREIFRLRRAQREARRIFLRPRATHALLTGQSDRGGAVEPGVVCLRWPSLGAHVEEGRGARAAGAIGCAA